MAKPRRKAEGQGGRQVFVQGQGAGLVKGGPGLETEDIQYRPRLEHCPVPHFSKFVLVSRLGE